MRSINCSYTSLHMKVFINLSNHISNIMLFYCYAKLIKQGNVLYLKPWPVLVHLKMFEEAHDIMIRFN